MNSSYGTIVIGSGFGGAVSACRLAEAGEKMLVLERGKRWRAEEFPRALEDQWLFDVDEPEQQHGWIDLRLFRHVGVIQGAGVGGGSLIYANVSVPAERFAFDSGWPAEITGEELAPHYATTGRMLDVQQLPEGQVTKRLELMREAAAAIGDANRFRKLPLAVRFDPEWSYATAAPHDQSRSRFTTNAFGRRQGTCIHCGNCDIGCPVAARNTLDLNYLAVAEDKGAEIRPLHLVHSIERIDGAYRVHYRRLDTGEINSDTAKRVIVAAGSLGSTELLLRCRDQHKTLPNISRQLGHGWCANGDFLTPAIFDGREISPTWGPTITAAIDYLDGSDGGRRYFVEDGGFPDVIGNLMRASVLRKRGLGSTVLYLLWRYVLGRRLKGRNFMSSVMPWFGQGVDCADGVMTLRRQWFRRHQRLMLDYDVSRSRPVVEAMIHRHKRLTEAAGGSIIVPPSWSLFRYLITPHPLGGCNMGRTAADGVVDHKGEVFGYPGLYVLDGSIVPRALGLNPSRTIAALTERSMSLMLQ